MKAPIRLPLLLTFTLLIALAGCGYQAEDSGAMSEPMTESAPGLEKEMAADTMAGTADAPMAEQRAAGVSVGEAMSPSAPVGMSAAAAATVQRKVIKTAQVDLEVEKIGSAQKQIIDMVDRANGFIQSMTVNDYDTSRQADMIARVPSDHFREVYEGVKELGEVTRDHIGGQDVTQEYMDLERRIANLQAQEERLRELFNDAKTVEDLLKVEQRLTQVRGQIEQLQGRLRYLKDQVGFSTLTIALYEPGDAPVEEPEGWKIGYHVRGAWSALVGAFRKLVYGLIWIVITGSVVWIPLAIIIWLIRRWAIRRREQREAEEQSPAPPSEE
jgi:hypothetical protein